MLEKSIKLAGYKKSIKLDTWKKPIKLVGYKSLGKLRCAGKSGLDFLAWGINIATIIEYFSEFFRISKII